MMGELTEVLAPLYPDFVTHIADPAVFDPECPPADRVLDAAPWPGVAARRVYLHDFTYIADFGDEDELAAIVGRIYGPVAAAYVRTRGGSTLAWRLRITYAHVAK